MATPVPGGEAARRVLLYNVDEAGSARLSRLRSARARAGVGAAERARELLASCGGRRCIVDASRHGAARRSGGIGASHGSTGHSAG